MFRRCRARCVPCHPSWSQHHVQWGS
jgi:hypothetical protein